MEGPLLIDGFVAHAFFSGPRRKLLAICPILGIDVSRLGRPSAGTSRLAIRAEDRVTPDRLAAALDAFNES